MSQISGTAIIMSSAIGTMTLQTKEENVKNKPNIIRITSHNANAINLHVPMYDNLLPFDNSDS